MENGMDAIAGDGLDDEFVLAVETLEEEIACGVYGPDVLTVRGEPIGLVLPLDELAALIRRGARPRPVPALAPALRPRRST
jgi:hypothetical protein